MKIFFSIDMKLQIEYLPRESESSRLFKMNPVKPKHWAFSAHTCFRSLCTRWLGLLYYITSKIARNLWEAIASFVKHWNIFLFAEQIEKQKNISAVQRNVIYLRSLNKIKQKLNMYIYLCRYLLFVLHNIILLQIIPKFGRNI